MVDITNSDRYIWMQANPHTARYLLLLLLEDKGNTDDFDKLLDRLIRPEKEREDDTKEV